MNKGHINSGEVINLGKLRKSMDVGASHALIRTEEMEVIRMALPQGKKMSEHSVDGQITIQCLQGEIQLNIGDAVRNLRSEDWLFLEGKVPHSLTVKEDAVLLLTILFTDQEKEPA